MCFRHYSTQWDILVIIRNNVEFLDLSFIMLFPSVLLSNFKNV